MNRFIQTLERCKWHLSCPFENSWKQRLQTALNKHSKRRDAEHFALNLYEKLYFHVRDGGSSNAPKFSKAFDAWKKACAKKKTTLKKGVGKTPLPQSQ
ncbi:hypothetical protein N9K52_02635 [Litoricolaceae bacterium]|jgi:hypothetical protein|nr:hypothetical protein [Litorivicinaceae bacterium]